MPATAGRVRMPANNRVHSSAALQTHGIWQSAIGYDPYAPDSKAKADPSKLPSSSSSASAAAAAPAAASADRGGENAYTSFQGLLALARITGSNSDDTRGACKKCGRVGHLTFQCRNFLSVKSVADVELDDSLADAQAAALAKFDEIKKAIGGAGESTDEEDEDDSDSDSSDSDVDPELERIIAERERARNGAKRMAEEKKVSHKSRGMSKHRRSRKSDGEGGEEKRTRSKHRSSDEDDESGSDRKRHRKSRKDKKRRRSHRRSEGSSDEDESGEERERRRRHRHKRRHRRRDASDSGSESGGSESLDDRRRSSRPRRHHRSEGSESDADEHRGRKGTKRADKKRREHKMDEKY